MTTSSVTHPDTATYAFPSSAAAWAFLRACDGALISAGFPSVDGKHTVAVSIRTWMDREATDRFAGAKPVSYTFGTAPKATVRADVAPPSRSPKGCGHTGDPDRTCSDCAWLP